MKIYTLVKIDPDTLQTIYESSYNHDGPVVECKGGGGGTKTEYVQSPEQRQIYGYLRPLAEKISRAGQFGAPLWRIPPYQAAPHVPTMGGVLSGVSPFGLYQDYSVPSYSPTGYQLPGWYTPQTYETQTYGIPSAEMMMPAAGWYKGLAPEVRAGLSEPYREAERQMIERMGGAGGSARAGYTGAAGAALGELAAEEAKDVGLQAWQMTAPAYQARWQAELGRGREFALMETERLRELAQATTGAERERVLAELTRREQQATAQTEADRWATQQELTRRIYGAEQRRGIAEQTREEFQQERLADYQQELGRIAQDYGAQKEIWAQKLQARQFPFTALPGMLGGTYSTPIVQQGGPGFGQQMGTALGMGGLGYLGASQGLLGTTAMANPLTAALLIGGTTFLGGK